MKEYQAGKVSWGIWGCQEPAQGQPHLPRSIDDVVTPAQEPEVAVFVNRGSVPAIVKVSTFHFSCLLRVILQGEQNTLGEGSELRVDECGVTSGFEVCTCYPDKSTHCGLQLQPWTPFRSYLKHSILLLWDSPQTEVSILVRTLVLFCSVCAVLGQLRGTSRHKRVNSLLQVLPNLILGFSLESSKAS